MNSLLEVFSRQVNFLFLCNHYACCSRWVEALSGRILVPLLILDAGAGMRLPLPSPRPFESDVVVLATAVLTIFPKAKKKEKIKHANIKQLNQLLRNTLCHAREFSLSKLLQGCPTLNVWKAGCCKEEA